MTVMNALGVQIMSYPSDLPGHRSWRVLEPTVPPGPYAQHVIVGYLERITPWYNNPRNKNFVDRPEYSGTRQV